MNADITVGEINIPYFRTQGLSLQTNLQNLSQAMAQSNGTVSFSLQPGAITDMDKLLKQSKIVQIILLPLQLLNQVGKKLNLDLFDESAQTKKGEIALPKGEGHYTFTKGVMRIDSTSFESSLTNIQATGTIDFPADKLNMKASATLVTKQTPVVFKITGTLDNPSGKLDVTDTLGSVLGGILNYKATKASDKQAPSAQTTEPNARTSAEEAAQDVKAAAKALGNLFKKNKTTSSN